MAGVAAAYHLAARHGLKNVVLVDERAPFTLTTDKGTAAYRNWFPGPGDTMVRFINRSIDLLETLAEASGDAFHLNRRGYVFLTAQPDHIPVLRRTAAEISALGAGPLREHLDSASYIPAPPEDWHDLPTGADLVLDQNLIRHLFPFVSEEAVAMLHVRRAGFFDSMRLGGWLLDRARESGVQIRQDRVESVTVRGGQVQSIHFQSGDAISAETFVIAAGPYLKQVAALLGVDVPVFNELHAKITFKDELGLAPPTVPLMIWDDPMRLPWTEAERAELAANDETRWLLDEFPAGVHFRPKGDLLLGLWTYDIKPQEPVWPPTFEPHYAEVILRGLSRMIPKLSAYFGQGRMAYVDGGYYCKTRENRPLIGPLPVAGAYVIGALSGYGVMGSQAAAELLAAHVVSGPLPDYAPFFRLERYDDPEYQSLLASWDQRSGQL